ncbi:hypothetical protein CYMTET_32015, partial [Cymbomonas tetramitiformis]
LPRNRFSWLRCLAPSQRRSWLRCLAPSQRHSWLRCLAPSQRRSWLRCLAPSQRRSWLSTSGLGSHGTLPQDTRHILQWLDLSLLCTCAQSKTGVH